MRRQPSWWAVVAYWTILIGSFGFLLWCITQGGGI